VLDASTAETSSGRLSEISLEPRVSADDFAAALERSQNYLLSIQKPEGYWIGELIVDVTLVADMVAYHHWNGDVDRAWEKKAIHHIFSKQLFKMRGQAEIQLEVINSSTQLADLIIQFPFFNTIYHCL